MNLVRFGLLFSIIYFMGCSNTVSGSSGEDQFAEENSSSSKDNGKNEGKSSSSQSSDENSEECVGESGSPWDGTTAKEFACGSGTKLSPYVILNAEQLAHFSFVVGGNDADYIGKYYKLGADILLNGGKIINDKGALVADSSKLHKWTPIGNSSVAFSGHFDGNGYSISGMFINTTSSHNGLFGNVSGSVSNLTVENSWVTGGKFTGGIVGLNIGTLENLKNKAAVIGNDDCTGGVVGISKSQESKKNAIIKNVINYGVVNGIKNVGGVAGEAWNTKLDSTKNFANVNGKNYVGGIIGKAGYNSVLVRYFITANNSQNYGDVSGKEYVAGFAGICGEQSCTSSSYSLECGNLSNIGNSGSIIAENNVGGIIGTLCRGTIKLIRNTGNIEGIDYVSGLFGAANFSTTTSLYNTGDVAGLKYVGGIIGYNKEGVTSSAYSTGKVDGDSLVGLMIGYNYNTTMADYYYLEQGELEPFGENNGGGVATPKTASEMKTEDFAELVGEDFVYDSGLNDGYPVLSWEAE